MPARSDPARKHGLAVSVKGVVLLGDRVLLLRNERDEWELPGGRPEPGETWRQALQRELREETNIGVEIGPLVLQWRYEVLPGRSVWIAAFGCRAGSATGARVSAEHTDLRFFNPADVAIVCVDRGYRTAIDAWRRLLDGRSIM